MKTELLVDAGAFWTALASDLRTARRRAWIQTFTFEGDRVGRRLERALARCPARDRRLFVDRYSLLYHNDRLITGPAWLEPGFRREVFLTHRLLRRLREAGVGARWGNRLGPNPVHLIRRNHKKLVVVDDVAYLGGINFSEHNFAWHDMMIRVQDPELADALARDFHATWRGRPRSMDLRVNGLRVLSLDGRGNARRIRPVVDAVAAARRSVDVQSAYLSHPFTDHLAAAARRGVRVRILTPARNNKGNLARHILQAAHRHGFEVLHSPGMSHLKAMLVDDELLVAGSSNFDFMSYHILEELVVLTRDPSLVEAYRARVWAPDAAGARRVRPRPSLGTRLGHAAVRAGSAAAGLLARNAAPMIAALLAASAWPALAAAQDGGAGRRADPPSVEASVGLAVEPPSALPALKESVDRRPAWAEAGVPEGVWRVAEFAASLADDEAARALLGEAEAEARRAVASDPDAVGARFGLAVVLGMRADREGGRARVQAAAALHRELEEILARDPEHPRARHLLGRLPAGVQRWNGVVRWIAPRLLGGGALDGGSWGEAERHLAFAEAAEPQVADHHLQLANLYRDTGRPKAALEEVEHVLARPAATPREEAVRAEALALRESLGG